MPKIDIETIKQILHRNESDIQKVNSILEDLKLEIQIKKKNGRIARPDQKTVCCASG